MNILELYRGISREEGEVDPMLEAFVEQHLELLETGDFFVYGVWVEDARRLSYSLQSTSPSHVISWLGDLESKTHFNTASLLISSLLRQELGSKVYV